jgi:hypothetical protein
MAGTRDGSNLKWLSVRLDLFSTFTSSRYKQDDDREEGTIALSVKRQTRERLSGEYWGHGSASDKPNTYLSDIRSSLTVVFDTISARPQW